MPHPSILQARFNIRVRGVCMSNQIADRGHLELRSVIKVGLAGSLMAILGSGCTKELKISSSFGLSTDASGVSVVQNTVSEDGRERHVVLKFENPSSELVFKVRVMVSGEYGASRSSMSSADMYLKYDGENLTVLGSGRGGAGPLYGREPGRILHVTYPLEVGGKQDAVKFKIEVE